MSAEQESRTSSQGAVGMLREVGRKLAQGEAGPLLVLLMVGAIWTFFQLQNDRFLSAGNLTNLMLQQAAVATISIGVVLILLLGEIDLSVGAVSGLCASVMAVLVVQQGMPPVLAVLVALGLGAVIGLFNGVMITRFQIPSFVVTLAGSLAWVGFQLLVLGQTGTINLSDKFIIGLTYTYFPPAMGWAVAALAIALTLGLALVARKRRGAAGLSVSSIQGLAFRTAVVGAAFIALIIVVNQDRGLPMVVFIVFVLALAFAYLTERTRFGRHMFAVGGNAEAARRAGIKIDHVRILVFMLGSTLASAGGILAASRLMAVNQSSGSSDLLLMAIAGPVIAGTSLFGGRGTVWSALLGAVVIGSIANGMNLLAFASSVKFIVTGAVLITAVTIEAMTRMRRQGEQRV
ncbi:MAG: ABC transporter permease [Actinobacteria bacterium HGW-Actinobacteria-7]|nr:MAG: ABC transporter permease [Actinobacteria bacterium HGW-Actinobacteria-7]